MPKPGLANDSVHWYMSELTSRIVAESGIPSDGYHLGKILLQSFKDAPDFLMQIDGATGEIETSGSMLKRSIRCATSFRNLGLKRGDVMILMAPNNIDLAVPYYAALYLGIIVAPVDRTLSVNELKDTFNVNQPKIIFCQNERWNDINLAINEMDTHIVTFDRGEHLCFSEFLEKYGDGASVDDFKPADFDPMQTIAYLVPTSGTTGLPKSSAGTHKNFAVASPYWWSRHSTFPSPTRMALICAPLQWLSAIYNFLLSPVLRYTRLQSSLTLTQEHAQYLFKKYQPTFMYISPTLMTSLMKEGEHGNCDFTCFEFVILAGSAVPRKLLDDIAKVAPDTIVINAFGMTEVTSIVFHGDFSTPVSCGKPHGPFQYRIVNVENETEITKPNTPGELWLKGPGIFKEYYNNPQATAESFSEDGWFKTGDLFSRDQNWNFFFVERLKLLLKYRNNQISPLELESVIRTHPAVLDVAVTGIPDPECGELPVACVVKRTGCDVTAQEVKDLVKNNLSDSKQLRGGVIFMAGLPMTASTKLHRRKLKEIVLTTEIKM